MPLRPRKMKSLIDYSGVYYKKKTGLVKFEINQETYLYSHYIGLITEEFLKDKHACSQIVYDNSSWSATERILESAVIKMVAVDEKGEPIDYFFSSVEIGEDKWYKVW